MDNEDIMFEDRMSEGYEPDNGWEPDDFETMNQNEADDYRNEGNDETPLGEEMGGE